MLISHVKSIPDKKLWVKLLAIPVAMVLAGGAVLSSNLFQGNFHAASPGELYRSAQPTVSQIALYKEQYGIKTIINLRGNNVGAPWYDAEVAEAKALGMTHVDFRMSARHELSENEAAALIALMKNAEKPILIHCQGGADRSGLAAALYIAAVAHGSERSAEAQMSIRYGHVSLSANPAYAMDRTFEKLEPWLGFNRS